MGVSISSPLLQPSMDPGTIPDSWVNCVKPLANLQFGRQCSNYLTTCFPKQLNKTVYIDYRFFFSYTFWYFPFFKEFFFELLSQPSNCLLPLCKYLYQSSCTVLKCCYCFAVDKINKIQEFFFDKLKHMKLVQLYIFLDNSCCGLFCLIVSKACV